MTWREWWTNLPLHLEDTWACARGDLNPRCQAMERNPAPEADPKFVYCPNRTAGGQFIQIGENAWTQADLCEYHMNNLHPQQDAPYFWI